MIEINLLPEEERQKKKDLSMPSFSFNIPGNVFFYAGIGAVVVLLIILMIIHFSQMGTIKRYRAKNDDLKKELKRLEEEKKKVENMKEKEAKINQKLETIKKLSVSKYTFTKFFDLLSQKMPDYLWFESISVKGSVFTISGKTFSNLMITDFMTSLKTMKDFIDPKSIVLKSIVNKAEAGHDVISFQITCKFLQ